MITKNLKNYLKCCLACKTTCLLPGKTPTNGSVYIAGQAGTFPSTFVPNFRTNKNAGIVVGTGNTPATEDDYFLESQITSGLSGSASIEGTNLDGNGNPYISIILTLNNTSANDIIVREIGCLQTFYTSATFGGGGTSNALLIDRTVLSSPVTVEAGGVAAIKYILKTVVNAS